MNKAQVALIAAASIVGASALFGTLSSAAETATTADAVATTNTVATSSTPRKFAHGGFGHGGPQLDVLAELIGEDVNALEAELEENTLSEVLDAHNVSNADLHAAMQDHLNERLRDMGVANETVQTWSDATEQLQSEVLAKQADALGVTVEELESARADGSLHDLIDASGLTLDAFQEQYGFFGVGFGPGGMRGGHAGMHGGFGR